MALFHRREQKETEILYQIGTTLEKTKLLVGLGNPGTKYKLTRHNIGYLCVENFVANEDGSWAEKKPLKSLIADIRIGQSRIIVCKPTTYMNLSGEAIQAVQNYFKINNTDTIIVHDDIDLVFGQIRTRVGGGTGGHNGIKSATQHIGENFGRIRVGIANEFSSNLELADFVLQKFSKTETDQLEPLKKEVGALLNEYVFGGQLVHETRTFL